MHRALMMQDVMKMKPAERKRRGKLIGARKAKEKPVVESEPAHPRLKRWARPEKPIEIVG